MRIGVVPGRFQVPDLHPAHHILLGSAMRDSDHLLIVVGVSEARSTDNDPLDFPTRKLMLANHYPEATIVALRDHASDAEWSKNLDEAIKQVASKGDKVTLYCGRDGFRGSYKGQFPVNEIPEIPEYAGTQLRTDARRKPKDSVDFREGVIYAAGRKFQQTYFTVDVAIVRKDGQVLLGHRKGNEFRRFPGGFVGFTDSSPEAACRRVLQEEFGLDSDEKEFAYAGGRPIDDWRYRGRSDARIMTLLYVISHDRVSGKPTPGEEHFESIAWTPLDAGGRDRVEAQHKQLFSDASRFVKQNAKHYLEAKK